MKVGLGASPSSKSNNMEQPIRTDANGDTN